MTEISDIIKTSETNIILVMSASEGYKTSQGRELFFLPKEFPNLAYCCLGQIFDFLRMFFASISGRWLTWYEQVHWHFAGEVWRVRWESRVTRIVGAGQDVVRSVTLQKAKEKAWAEACPQFCLWLTLKIDMQLFKTACWSRGLEDADKSCACYFLCLRLLIYSQKNVKRAPSSNQSY